MRSCARAADKDVRCGYGRHLRKPHIRADHTRSAVKFCGPLLRLCCGAVGFLLDQFALTVVGVLNVGAVPNEPFALLSGRLAVHVFAKRVWERDRVPRHLEYAELSGWMVDHLVAYGDGRRGVAVDDLLKPIGGDRRGGRSEVCAVMRGDAVCRPALRAPSLR